MKRSQVDRFGPRLSIPGMIEQGDCETCHVPRSFASDDADDVRRFCRACRLRRSRPDDVTTHHPILTLYAVDLNRGVLYETLAQAQAAADEATASDKRRWEQSYSDKPPARTAEVSRVYVLFIGDDMVVLPPVRPLPSIQWNKDS